MNMYTEYVKTGIKICLVYLHSPNTSSWRGAQMKHRDNFPIFFLDLKLYFPTGS